MKYTTIFEKIACFFGVASNSLLHIVFLVLIVFLLFLLGFKKISKKTCFILSCLSCFIIFGFTLYEYFDEISKIFDNLMEHLFTEIYFPSAYAYLFVLLLINIVAVGSLLNPKISKTYKTIHGISFLMINFLLSVILEMIAKNQIDIFSKKSLFSNTDLIILLEFSVNIFVFWFVGLVTLYIIDIIAERISLPKQSKVKKPAVITSSVEIIVNEEKMKEEYQNQNKELSEVNSNVGVITENNLSIEVDSIDTTDKHFIPEFSFNSNENINLNETEKVNILPEYVVQPAFNPVTNFVETSVNNNLDYSVLSDDVESVNDVGNNNTFDLSAFIPKKQEVKPIIQNNISNKLSDSYTSELFDNILNNNLSLSYENNIVKQEVKKEEFSLEKDTYTLNDYKVVSKMLKDIREHNQSDSVQIDKMLEYRLITKYSTETYDMFKKMLKIYSN